MASAVSRPPSPCSISGIACEVHERAPELREIGAGLSLWPAPLRVFDGLGLGARGPRPRRGRGPSPGSAASDGTALVQYTAEQLAARLGEATIGVHRGELQALLLDALAPGTVHTGRECVAVDDAAPGPVRATFADGSEAFGRALIAADGRRSSIRRMLFGQGELHDCRAVAWRGTAVEPPGVDWHSFAGESWGRAIRFGILPISGNRVTWFASARAFEHDGSKDELRARLAHFHDPIPAAARSDGRGEHLARSHRRSLAAAAMVDGPGGVAGRRRPPDDAGLRPRGLPCRPRRLGDRRGADAARARRRVPWPTSETGDDGRGP